MKDTMERVSSYKYVIRKHGAMHVDAEYYLNDALLEHIEDKAVQQLVNVACLPGIYSKALAMPDCHTGYGFPIGGVAAIDREEGCISPGGIGFDINCGVRLLVSNLTEAVVRPRIQQLILSLFRHVPSGVGGESKLSLDDEDLDDVLTNGVQWPIRKGLGVKEDGDVCEEYGRMRKADSSKVSPRAKKRGRKQLGTLGAGNHFLEVQFVDEVFDADVASVFGIEEGSIVIMIHCGSRGLGHQVCSDFLRRMEDSYPKIMDALPEKDLIYAPAGSKLAQEYFAAMAASANFAWANRHIIGHKVRESFKEVFPDVSLRTLYDVAHNIAKEEEYVIDGSERKVWTHRKGATRAFGPGNKHLPEVYRDIGQPVILPGSMGTASYILVGTKQAEDETFGSTAHGAGRLMSRMQAKKTFDADTVKKEMERDQIYVKSASRKGISEEAPGVYKNVDDVVEVSDQAGIAKKVARLRPIGVIKG